jgi:hypothetical protein
MAAEKLAMAGAMRCEFRAHAGSAEDTTYVAFLHIHPASAMVALYVRHKHSGRFVCRSVAATVDTLDESAWNIDTTNALDVARGT